MLTSAFYFHGCSKVLPNAVNPFYNTGCRSFTQNPHIWALGVAGMILAMLNLFKPFVIYDPWLVCFKLEMSDLGYPKQ